MATLATLSIIFLCHYTTASSISPIILHKRIYNHHHLAQPNNNKQRKNNTGFYYGIRDDHISCASSCSLPLMTLSWKPALGDLTLALQRLPYRITLLAREQVERMQHRNNRVTGRNSCATGAGNASCELDAGPSLCQPQQMSQEENQSKDFFQQTFLQNSLRNLSQSLKSRITQQNQGLCSMADTFVNNSEKEDILGKAMSLLGGGSSVSRHCHLQQDDDHQDNVLVSLASVISNGGKRLRIAIEMGSGIVGGKLLTDDDDDDRRLLLCFLLTLLLLLPFMLLRLVSVLDARRTAGHGMVWYHSKPYLQAASTSTSTHSTKHEGHRSHFSFSIFTFLGNP